LEITIDIPEQTTRKIRAFGILFGGEGADMETTLLSILDEALSAAIVSAVASPEVSGFEEEITPSNYRRQVQAQQRQQQAARAPKAPRQGGKVNAWAEQDLSGISDGLGDDDTEEDDLTADRYATADEGAFVPSRGGLTERDLERDMELEDPDHEAKVDAGREDPRQKMETAEHLFSNMAGLPTPPPIFDPRAASRKKKLNSKAKVTYAAEMSETN
jgi:hypothetical protein